MWDFFDSIYCINLRERKDRLEHMSKLFKELSIKAKFFHPNRHPISGQQGCYESHLSVMKKAYDSGDKYCLIFEDDVVTSSKCNDYYLKKAISFIQNCPDLDIFYLAYVPLLNLEAPRKIDDSIYQVRAASASSYIVSRKFMEKILDSKYVGIPVDIFYALSSNHAYCLGDSMFYSKEFTSDIERTTKNKRKFMSVDLDFWMYFLHCYVKYVNLSLAQLTILLILVVIILLLMWIFDPKPKIAWILFTLLIIFILYTVLRDNLILKITDDPR